jgi:hypothetical protein
LVPGKSRACNSVARACGSVARACSSVELAGVLVEDLSVARACNSVARACNSVARACSSVARACSSVALVLVEDLSVARPPTSARTGPRAQERSSIERPLTAHCQRSCRSRVRQHGATRQPERSYVPAAGLAVVVKRAATDHD